MKKTPAQSGFTLVEVMLALAIVAIALVGMMAETASNIRATQEANMRGVVVDLLRAKMYDIENELKKDGFQDLEQSTEGDFSDEGWPDISWESKVEKVEIPALDTLSALQQGKGDEAGRAGAAAGGTGSPLIDLMASFGGGLGSDSAEGASFIAQYFDTLTQVLEGSIRKVTVTARWQVGNEDQEMLVAQYLTDPNAIDKVLMGAGRDDESDSSSSTPSSGQGGQSGGRGPGGSSSGQGGRGSGGTTPRGGGVSR